jgi:hypothetical protein
LLTPGKRILPSASSAKSSIRRTKFWKSLEDGARLFRDLKEALFGAYDGVRT